MIFLVLAYIKQQSLEEHIEHTNAVVVKLYSSTRMSNYLDYKFFVGKKEYHGSGYWYPKSDTLSVGDSINIVYDTINPKNNEPWRDL